MHEPLWHHPRGDTAWGLPALVALALASTTCSRRDTTCDAFVERYAECVPDSPRGVTGIGRYCTMALEPQSRQTLYGDLSAPMEECAKLTSCEDFKQCLNRHQCVWNKVSPTDTPEFSCSGMVLNEE